MLKKLIAELSIVKDEDVYRNLLCNYLFNKPYDQSGNPGLLENDTVKEICDAAVIRRPTFYKHFLDKYDFLSFFIKHKMGIIFDHAFHNLNDDGTNFFILVFEQLLDQFDNLSFLIFRLQMNSDINIELENIQEYGQNMLNKRVSGGENTSGIAMGSEYKGQIIMGITIQSVYWYKNNQDRMSRTEIIELYQQTLAKLW